MGFCTSCGENYETGAQFCGKCGAHLPSQMHEAGHEYATPEVAPYTEEAPDVAASKSNKIWLAVIVLAVLALSALYYFLFLRDDMKGAPAQTSAAAPTEATPEAPVAETTYFAVTRANIRDRATTVGTNITGSLQRGDEAKGSIILGEDGKTNWLKLSADRGFVSMINLAEIAPPTLVKSLGDKIWVSTKPLVIFAQPDRSAAEIARVGTGTRFTLSGMTANDFLEVKLARGGVGYLTGGAALLTEVEKPKAPAVAIKFDASNCNFGPELQALFERLFAQAQARSKSAETADYPDDQARSEALAKLSEKSLFLTLDRSFAGLSVKGLGQHLEAQSVYFAEPLPQVISALRDAGFSIARDGTIGGGDTFSSGVYAVQGPGTKYGRTELSCGV